MRRCIDPHVHCRDWSQAYKATIRSVTEIARSQDVVAICDMPNTSPPIITRELVRERLRTASQEGCLEGYYLYIGVTDDVKQVKKAVEAVESEDRLVGMKMYAGRSVGSISVIAEAAQKCTYKVLADLNYRGVIVVHCEKESLFRMELWNPLKASTWNLARPIEACVESINDQIRFAIESGFKGHLHIAHVSSVQEADLVYKAKGKISITCGVTPHHLLLSTEDMNCADGIRYKVNPPLREPEVVSGLNDALRAGKIDWIETDHAPHSEEEKSLAGGIYMSGIQSLSLYKKLLAKLSKDGISDKQIEELTYSRIKRVLRNIVE